MIYSIQSQRLRLAALLLITSLAGFLSSSNSKILLVESSSPPWEPSYFPCNPSSQPPMGWRSRRIANRILSSSQSRMKTDPIVAAVAQVVVSKRNCRSATPQQPQPPQSPSSLSVPQRLISGGCSRGIAQALLYPVDALRTLAQTRDGRTLADVGWKALIRGCGTTSSFAVAIGAIQFAVFGAFRDTCGPLVASALGAAGSCLVSVPQEVLKQRLVAGVYPSFRTAVATIAREEGLSGFYSAWKPTLARNVPFVVAAFTSMDVLKQRRLAQKRQERDDPQASLSVVENLTIGISSSLIAATLTHPADVVKTRMMTQAASTAVPYASALDCLRTMVATEGWASLYAGFAQRSAYMGPLWALQFALHGKFDAAFRRKPRRHARGRW